MRHRFATRVWPRRSLVLSPPLPNGSVRSLLEAGAVVQPWPPPGLPRWSRDSALHGISACGDLAHHRVYPGGGMIIHYASAKQRDCGVKIIAPPGRARRWRAECVGLPCSAESSVHWDKPSDGDRSSDLLGCLPRAWTFGASSIEGCTRKWGRHAPLGLHHLRREPPGGASR
jgi:hypothetical protein